MRIAAAAFVLVVCSTSCQTQRQALICTGVGVGVAGLGVGLGYAARDDEEAPVALISGMVVGGSLMFLASLLNYIVLATNDASKPQ